MKDFLAKFIRGQNGFSLVQTLVGAAIIGGLSLVAAKLSTQEASNKMVSDANYSVLDLTGRIQTLVSNRDSCKLSFEPHNVALDATVNIPSLKTAPGGADLFVVNGLYDNNKVRISAMTFTRTERNSVLSVTMNRMIAGKATVSSTVKKDFFINAEWAGNTLVSCASDISNFMDTVLAEALDQACPEDSETDEEGFVRDTTDDERCNALYQMKQDNSLLRCPAEQTIVGLSFNTTTLVYTPICKVAIKETITTCLNNQLLKRDVDGNYVCVDISCPPNQVALGLDANGVMRCMGCSSGQFLVATASGWKCSSSMCMNSKNASQQYFVGFNANGDPVCNPIINSGSTCTEGGQLRVGTNGQVELACCTPQCSNTADKCEGTTYAADNLCGVCKGTKPADCSNASNYCVGTTNASANGCGTCAGTKAPDCSNSALYCSGQVYTSHNGCGTCTGSKAAVNATWGAWTATTDVREKSGATCSATCGGGTKTAQRRYIRSCNNDNACGGTTCVGPTEEWRDEGTIACNTQTCGNYKWCSSPAPYQACVCMNVDTGQYPVAIEYCQNSSTSCMLEDCEPTFEGGTTTSGGGGCFVAGTQVTMHDGSLKNIEDILVGDKVLDGQKKVVTVQKLIPLDYAGEIYGINGGGYFFTPNHPFLTTDGWKSLDPKASMKETPGLKVSQLKIGDILIKKNGVEVILTLESIYTRELVYNFELDGSHEYMADDYVVHNKKAPLEPAPLEP